MKFEEKREKTEIMEGQFVDACVRVSLSHFFSLCFDVLCWYIIVPTFCFEWISVYII